MFNMRLDPPTRPAGEFHPPEVVCGDYASEVMGLCEVLGTTDCRFHVGGFGVDSWPVDVSYDLSVVIEQLPQVIRALIRGADTELDFYSQGIERTLEFHTCGDICHIKCESRTGWVPSPHEIEMKTQDVIAMLQRLAKDFGQAVAIAAPGLASLSPFAEWRTGEYEW